MRSFLKICGSIKTDKNFLANTLLDFKDKFIAVECLAVHLKILSKRGNAYDESEIRLRFNSISKAVFKRIIAFQDDVFIIRSQFRRHQDTIDDNVPLMHKSGQNKFGPALIKICCTTAEMRFQAKQMSVRPIGSKQGFPWEFFAADLIAHLNVLMSPHVVVNRSRQCIKSKNLQPFSPLFVPCVSI